MEKWNCDNWKPRLSEYADGTLDVRQSLKLQSHLTECAECARIVKDFEATTSLLQGLSTRTLSSDFEANLARRLRSLDLQPQKIRWADRLWDVINPRVLKPALAFGTAALALGGVVFFMHPTIVNTGGAVAPSASSVDQTLVSQCVDQHQSYVATQPMTDWSAQNLSGHLDKMGSSDSLIAAGSPSADSL